jgi:cell division protein FtsL
MTPSALTPAARGSTKKSRPDAGSRPSPARGSGHRSNVRRSVAPTAARRVSGPAGAVVSGGVIAVPAPTRTRPSRDPRPRTAPSRPRTRPSVARAPWRLRTAAFVRALPDHVLLDRVIRGRAWIPLLGMLLAGIVAMQVEVLKLNAGIGRSLERGTALQAQNELLRASVAQLSDEQRIERMAAQMGMAMPAPGQFKFVSRGTGSVERALSSIHAPNGTNFLAQLPTIGAPATAQGTSVSPGVSLAPTGTASTTSSAATTSSPATTASTTSSDTTSAGTTSAGTTPAGTTSAGTTSASTPVTPTAPSAPAGTTGQSGGPSSTGGVGVTPVGG